MALSRPQIHELPPSERIDAATGWNNTLENLGWLLLENVTTAWSVEYILSHFGRIIPQYDGRTSFEVRYSAKYSSHRYSQSNNELQPHTDAPAHQVPPRYLALWCLHQARCGGGETLLADGYRFIETLPDGLRGQAGTQPIRFVVSPYPGATSKHVLSAPVFAKSKGAAILRFSQNLFEFGDANTSVPANLVANQSEADMARDVGHLGRAFFYANCIRVKIPDGAILIWNNHRMMHARTGFRDTDRHLIRYWLA